MAFVVKWTTVGIHVHICMEELPELFPGQQGPGKHFTQVIIGYPFHFCGNELGSSLMP